MLLFLRSSDIAIDARLGRYGRALAAGGIGHAALYWNREGTPPGDRKMREIRYDRALSYGSRGQTALRLIGLNLFALRRIWRLRRRIRAIHAVDLDTAVVGAIASRITGIPLIYDIYDHYPDSRGITGMASRFCDWAEQLVFRQASLVILADECRIAQHRGVPADRWLIVENVPDTKRRDISCAPAQAHSGGRIRIGYLGTLEQKYRGIEDMLALVEEDPCLELEIAGAGTLEGDVRAAARRCERIRFHGPLEHREGLGMLASCDVVMGLYYAAVPNHRYAAPNKYFEHLLLGRPMLTSRLTPPGEKVRALDTGWAVDDGIAGIRAALAEAKERPDLVARKGENAARQWDDRFSGYFEDVLVDRYVPAVRCLMKRRRAALRGLVAQPRSS